MLDRCKTKEKGRSKTTLLDIKMEEDVTSNKKLTKKDYNRPDIILQNRKFNVAVEVPHTPGDLKLCTQPGWQLKRSTDHVSKTGSKIKARLCTIGNSSEFSKDSVQFESPTCVGDSN